MPKEPFRDPSEPLFEQRINELEEGKQLAASAITTEKIAASAVTTAKIAAGSINAEKITAPAAKPAEPAEKAVTNNAAAPPTKICFAYKSDGVETALPTMTHNMGTRLVQVTGQKEAAKEPATNLVVSGAAEATAFKWEASSANAIKVTLGGKPVAGEIYFFTIVG